MTTRLVPFIVSVMLLGLLPVSAVARAAAADHLSETKSDRVYVNVRRSNVRNGPGPDHKALRVMSAGDGLEVIGSKGNWFKVKLEDGKVGWINRRAVTRTPPADVVISQLRSQLALVKQENDGLKQEITRLSDARQDLELENSRLKAQVNLLAMQNDDLKSWRAILWVALGLGVLCVGWVLGFLTGMFRKQADDRRYDRLMRDAGTKNV